MIHAVSAPLVSFDVAKIGNLFGTSKFFGRKIREKRPTLTGKSLKA